MKGTVNVPGISVPELHKAIQEAGASGGTGGGSATLEADRALVSDAEGKTAVSETTATELGHLHGVTSNVQEQLDAIKGTADSAAGGLSQKADKPKPVAVTLTAAGWNNDTKKQAVAVSGVSATAMDQKFEPCLTTEADITAYWDAGIRIVGQAADSLTFLCDEIPQGDIPLYIVITPLG